MSRIGKDEHSRVAHASTLMSVLRAFSAPMGVAVLSSFVQGRIHFYTTSLAAQGVTGDQLTAQSNLLAMHASFLLGAGLALGGLAMVALVPLRGPVRAPITEPSTLAA